MISRVRQIAGSFGSETIPAHAVHGAFIAALGDGYADVRSADGLVTGSKALHGNVIHASVVRQT